MEYFQKGKTRSVNQKPGEIYPIKDFNFNNGSLFIFMNRDKKRFDGARVCAHLALLWQLLKPLTDLAYI